MFDGDATSVSLDPAHLEIVRGYLAGETAFPDGALAVTATVVTDFFLQNTCFGPSLVTDNPGIVYSLLIKGLYYRFEFAENHPQQIHAISCVGPGPALIFRIVGGICGSLMVAQTTGKRYAVDRG